MRRGAVMVFVVGAATVWAVPHSSASEGTAAPERPGITLDDLRELRPTESPTGSEARRDTVPRGGCDQPVVRDGSGDGPIDIRSAQITSDCENWRVSIDTYGPMDLNTLDYWAVQIDVDLDLSTGCRGTDVLIVSRPSPHHPSRLSAASFDTINCDESTWDWSGLSAGRDGDSLWVQFSGSVVQNTRSFRWFVAALRVGADSYDSAPDGAWRLARSVPSAPAPVHVVPAVEGFQARWWEPLESGGARIDGYRVEYKKSSDRRWQVRRFPASARTAVLASLSPRTRYQVRVAAINAVGVGQWSSSVVRVVGVPSPPHEPWSIRGEGVARLIWSPPVDDGGQPVSSFEVTLRAADGSSRRVALAHPLATQVVVTGLDDDQTYTASIRVSNGLAVSAPVEFDVADPGETTAPRTVVHAEGPRKRASGRASTEARFTTLDCAQGRVGDRLADAALDVTSAVITSGDCRRWSVWVYADIRSAASPLRTVDVWIDADLDLRTGCRGADRLVTLTPQGSRLVGRHSTTPSCAPRTWTKQPATRGTLEANVLGTAVPGLPSGVRWWLASTSADGSTDRVPDRGWAKTVSRPRAPVDLVVDDGDRETTTLSWSPPLDTGGLPVIRYEVVINGQTFMLLPSERSLEVPPSILDWKSEALVYAVTAHGTSVRASVSWRPRLRPRAPTFSLTMRRDGVLLRLNHADVDPGYWPTLSRSVTLQNGFDEPVAIGFSNVPTYPLLTGLTPGQDYTVTVVRRTAMGTSAPTSITFIAP